MSGGRRKSEYQKKAATKWPKKERREASTTQGKKGLLGLNGDGGVKTQGMSGKFFSPLGKREGLAR